MHAAKRLVLGMVGALLATLAAGQEATTRILVGFPPGGGSDLIARVVAERLKVSLGTPVVVENRPGASGGIAAEALKSAAPDGRTLMVSPIGVSVFAPLTHTKLRYDPYRDFAPVSLAATFEVAIAVGPGSPAKTLREYVEWVRANPSQGTYGIPVVGGPSHFFAVMFGRAAAIDFTAVPYKGGPPMVTDLVGGQVPAAVTSFADLLPQHQAGRIRILAVSGARRPAVAPEVPTFKELGFAGIEGTGWQAFHTTAGTPRAVIERLGAAIGEAIRAPEVRERLAAVGLEPVGSTPDELASRMSEERERWAPVVKATGFRAEQ